uniref:N-acetylmuramoyl-L-alanine amidase-like domain-containing protein n=1 Tax=Desertifilum tharense IPPAS B-1220 TaxID=1781255 RepID=A0ACD5GRA6_9CYAN
MTVAREQQLATRPMSDIVQAIAEQLLGSAYQAGLLDESAEETLVASLTQFDCVLFVEAVLAIARGIALQDYTYSSFTQNLQAQRYWNGTI